MLVRVKQLSRSQVLRSIGGVGAAALLAQIMGLLAAPFASRLFSQGQFGQFGLFFGLTNALVTIALLGFNDAILAAADDAEAQRLFAGSLYSIALLTPVLGALSYLLIHFRAFGYGILPGWAAALIFIQVGAVACMMTFQAWLIRGRLFRPIAYGHITQGAVRSLVQVGTGIASAGFLGLAFSEVACRVAVDWVLLRHLRHNARTALQWPRSQVVRTMQRYRLFPLFRTPSTFANNVGTAMPAVLVTMAYGVSSAGLYTLMSTVIVGPTGLVQKAVGDVFLGHFVHEHRLDPASARAFIGRVAIALLIVGAIPALFLILWGPSAFALVFGEKWRTAGELASLMAPLMIADVAIGPLGGALNVVNRPDAKLAFDALRVTGFASAYLYAHSAGKSFQYMVGLFSLAGVVSYLVYGALIYYGVRFPRQVERVKPDLQAISG